VACVEEIIPVFGLRDCRKPQETSAGVTDNPASAFSDQNVVSVLFSSASYRLHVSPFHNLATEAELLK
jgi:hypothetical protein